MRKYTLFWRTLGRVGRVSQGVAGAAIEHPLEGVAEDPTGCGSYRKRPLKRVGVIIRAGRG